MRSDGALTAAWLAFRASRLTPRAVVHPPGSKRYRYESSEVGFAADLTVDETDW